MSHSNELLLTEPRFYNSLAHGIVNMEVSVHRLPTAWHHFVQNVPEVTGHEDDVIMILTSQPAGCDLLNISKHTALEQDVLLERFLQFSQLMKTELQKMGLNVWYDAVDPCTGQLAGTKGEGIIFPEVEIFQKMRNFETRFVEGCKVAVHPKMKTKFYPVTILTTASPEHVNKVLGMLEK